MPAIDHFDGHANLTQAQRRLDAPILAELLGASGRTRFVDAATTIPPAYQDGSLSTPYSTGQAAVDDIEANLDPSGLNPAAVFILPPGPKTETIVVRRPGLSISGVGVRESVQVGRIIYTNATAESLAAYLSSGTYSDLVNQGDAGPQDFEITHLTAMNGIDFLGVKGDVSPTRTAFCGGSVTYVGAIANCNIYLNGIYCRNCNVPLIYRTDFWASTDMHFVNCSAPSVQNLAAWNIILDYDSTDPNGDGGVNYGAGFMYVRSWDVTLLNEVGAGGAVELLFHLAEDDLAVAGAANLLARGSHVEGDMTLGSGAGTAVMNGCDVIGTITDPDDKLEWNEPTTPGITKEGGTAVVLQNKTGAASVKGTVVVVDASVDDAFDTAGTTEQKHAGAVYDTGVADGSPCRVVRYGTAQVLLEDGTGATRGQFVQTSASVGGRAVAQAGYPAAGRMIGMALETVSSGSDVLVRCAMRCN
jgi:hypothetical protein